MHSWRRSQIKTYFSAYFDHLYVAFFMKKISVLRFIKTIKHPLSGGDGDGLEGGGGEGGDGG